MKPILGSFAAALSLVFTIGCAKEILSERDQRMSQMRTSASIKRKELQQVVGNYQGSIVAREPGERQPALLQLELKDVPTPVEGQVDPVLIPVLTGHVRLMFGDQYVAFNIQKAEFDASQRRLQFVSSHPTYKDLVANLDLGAQGMSGSWVVEKIASGTIGLTRVATLPTTLGNKLQSVYQGQLLDNKSQLPDIFWLNLVTTQSLGDITISGSVRFYYSPFNAVRPEYQEERFTKVEFNVFTGMLTIETIPSEAGRPRYVLTGRVLASDGRIAGRLSSDSLENFSSFEVFKP